MLESLQRRHSDVKLSSSNQLTTTTQDFGLAPPRSPELRRHSDVSPASLKELEKVLGLISYEFILYIWHSIPVKGRQNTDR